MTEQEKKIRNDLSIRQDAFHEIEAVDDTLCGVSIQIRRSSLSCGVYANHIADHVNPVINSAQQILYAEVTEALNNYREAMLAVATKPIC